MATLKRLKNPFFGGRPMASRARKILKFMNKALYVVSIALLISGLALSFSPHPVQASQEPLSTTNGCSATAQKVHFFAVGEHVYIQYNDMGSGSHPWEIHYNNKTGKPIVSVASNPAVVGKGTATGDSGCFEAWIVQPEEADYVFKVDMGNKNHTYQVAALPTVTTTPPPPTDSTPTDPVPTNSTPTVTSPTPTDPTPSPTPSANAPERRGLLLGTLVPTTPSPTNPAPTDPPAGSPQPGSTPAPADPTEPPTTGVIVEPSSPAQNAGQIVAAIPSLPIPPAGDQNMLAPVTGADRGALSTGSAAGRELCMVGLAFLGLAMMISGTRSSFCGSRS
jgi:hypothetical protein